MLNKALAGALFLGAVSVLPAMADEDTIARFKGGIGVIPVSSGVTAAGANVTQLTSVEVNRNFVRPDLGDRQARCQGEGEREYHG
jgi:hypothetical protein